MRAALLIALGLALASCGGLPEGRMVSTTSSGCTYQAQPTGDFGGTDTFTCTVNGDQVLVRFDGTELSHGAVDVTILDSAGLVVLPTTSLSPGMIPSATVSSQGTAGVWTVRVSYSNADGTVDISASTGH